MIGRILAGRFRIVGPIGKGGMGVVYKAVHIEMDRICALKLLAPISNDTVSAVARFRREAKMSSRIDSPNAVTIYDFGEAEPGLLYLAMEYIEGESLADVIVRERHLPLQRALNITNQIARALAAAHSLGIVHRDLKPANIMLTRKNSEHEVVKVLDFGIAKTFTDNNDESLTQTGMLLGTPSYMSPEQVTGDVVDSRTDVYSLAIMVYQMLSGELPFEGNNARTQMLNRLNHEPKPLRRISPSLTDAIESVVMSGLARDPANRIANVQKFAAALSAAVATGESPTLMRKSQYDPTETYETLSASESTVTRVSPVQAKPRRPWFLIPIGVACLLFVAALLSAGGYYVYLRAKPATAEPVTPAPDRPATSQPNTKQPDADSYYAEGKKHQGEARSTADAGTAKLKNEAAIAAYRKAIAIQPNFAEAHENLGVALYDLGRTDGAITEFEIAIRQDGTPTAQVWANYGMALLVVNRFQEAAGAFAKSARLNPGDAELHYYRAFALHFAGDISGSRNAFAEYLKVSPAGEHATDVRAILAGRATPSLDSIVTRR
jgi:serine/threonine protein kinase